MPNPPPGIAGHNRTMVTSHYAVLPPDGILESLLPGWENVLVRFQTSPAMGARFAQALLEVAAGGGTVRPHRDGLQHVLYVLDGTLRFSTGGVADTLKPGGYAFLPAGAAFELRAPDGPARAIWIRKPYRPAEGWPAPAAFCGHLDGVERRFKHTDGRAWQHLLPDDLSFDMAVNVLSFRPGTHFPFVETHVMEHGLYMLRGQGLYLLGRDWHEVWAGDFVWMGSYLPQQFYCTGWEEASYLLYKDVGRDVLFDDVRSS